MYDFIGECEKEIQKIKVDMLVRGINVDSPPKMYGGCMVSRGYQEQFQNMRFQAMERTVEHHAIETLNKHNDI